ncbi:winged helix-turn-helix transcriptional regulator [Algicella marina]|uniref:Transcriptional regulator n=1 Tax=Algicella marina TaxID=2683284 RepID=A0A6P1T3A7_9RHOB|nr:helix-turn-helix domain-containing protein [Algicella marina]QHQ36497.1 transcriptional regulator [Algicella marina]
MSSVQKFSADCPCRTLFAEIADKWSMMVLTILDGEPRRFNDIKRRLEGVSQKSLTQTLRRLERNGIVTRRVMDTSPVAVEYEMSELGQTLLPPFRALYCWTHTNFEQVEKARSAFDNKAETKAA